MGARFADVRFVVGDRVFIGEIKVTSYLSIDEAFRTAPGQLLFYAHMQFESKPGLIALLDRLLDAELSAATFGDFVREFSSSWARARDWSSLNSGQGSAARPLRCSACAGQLPPGARPLVSATGCP